jgi:selenide,water dikinase
MLAGAMETLAEAGVALLGGHSLKDDEIKLGFAITGLIDPAVAASLETARADDLLVLTKPLGTGVLAFCEQIGRGNTAGMAAAAASMAALNKAAADAMKQAGASACTDITGFGLFGHLLRLARQSRLAAQVFADALPAFPGAVEALQQGIIPGAVERNREFCSESLQVAADVDEALVHLGCDAQTSGGLLIAIPPDRLPNLESALAERTVSCFVIGRFVGSDPGRLLLANFPDRHTHHAPRTTHHTPPMPTSPDPDSHQPGCCADIFAAKPGAAPSLPETQKAFATLMRSVQAPGALSEKAKELILFSLVVYSRCHPCFEAHLLNARELGLTQAELDEAAWCAIAMGGAPVKMFYQECLRRAQGSGVTSPR